MKSLLKVRSINSTQDVIQVRTCISQHEGVIACEINKEKGEVSIVYDNYFVKEEDFVSSIEELGYTVI